MKKIITGVGTIVFAAALIVAGTGAFFSDTETSFGNVFAAGSIDLKVDHQRLVYNGDECTFDCFVDESIDLVVNGSFEAPVVATVQGWNIYPHTDVPGWSAAWEPGQPTTFGGQSRPEVPQIELHRGVNGWAHAEGEQHTELDSDWDGPGGALNGEPALIAVYQDIATVPGEQYELRYAYSPRPSVDATNNTMLVRIDGAQVTSHSQAGGGSVSWTQYSYTFTAAGATTRIEFAAGGTGNAAGPFLDDVRLHPYTCDTVSTLPDHASCKLWEEKDLEEGDYFFDFRDIKPGDYGRNLISLHVYDNDAYLCLIAHDGVDYENGCTGPEIEAGDTTCGEPGAGDGELSENLSYIAWLDLNEDGDYDAGEPVVGQGVLAPHAHVAALDSTNPYFLSATTTSYITFAWCAGTISLVDDEIVCDGTTMGNEAQGDSFEASLSAYAVQVRHNDDFLCSDIWLGEEGEPIAQGPTSGGSFGGEGRIDPLPVPPFVAPPVGGGSGNGGGPIALRPPLSNPQPPVGGGSLDGGPRIP